MKEEIKKRFSKRDIYSVAIVTVIMVLLSRLIPLFTGSMGFLFYLFFFVPVFYLISGAVLGWQVQRNSRIIKIIPVLLSNLSIFEIFYTNINYYFTFSAVIILLGNYCFFAYSYNISLLNIQKKTGRTDLIKWNFDHTLSWKLIFILILFAVYYVSSIPLKTDLYVEQAKEYLKDKYHQDFSKDKARCNLWELDYVLYFYPDTETDTTFLVVMNAFDSGFIDYYKSVIYYKECYLLTKPYLDKISEDYYLKPRGIEIVPVNINSGKLEIDRAAWEEVFSIHPISLSEMIKKYSGRLEFICFIDFAFDLTDETTEQVYKSVFALIEKLSSENINYYAIYITFYPKRFFKGKSIENFRKENHEPLACYGYYPTDEIRITYENMRDIKEWQDINYFLLRNSKSNIKNR